MGNAVSAATMEFDGANMQWKPKMDMNLPRVDISVVYVPHMDRIYVIGGNDGNKFYSECEFYEPAKNKWTPIAPMSSARDSCAVSLFNGLYIYAFSGRSSFSPKRILDVIERFNINSNQWQQINVTNNSNWVPNDLSIAWQLGHNQICVFGGVVEGRRSDACHILDTTDGSWQENESMPDVASFSDVPEMANGRLYALGWTNIQKRMFVWDPTDNQWTVEPRF